MENRKKIVMLGCGSANLFAALYLLDHGYNGADITIIDAGKNPNERKRSEILNGFAGAGLFSDGKMIFSMHPDPLDKQFTTDERKDAHLCIQRIIATFVDPERIGIREPVPEELVEKYVDLNGLSLKQSTSWHIGTGNNVILAQRMYSMMVSMGVKFLFEAYVDRIDLDEHMITGMIGDERFRIRDYEALMIGVGKSGVDLLKRVAGSHGIHIRGGYVNIGGRFECPYNDTIKAFVTDIQYDFKFHMDYKKDNMIVRSFCVNNDSAYVIEEPINGIMTYNGHAYGLNHPKGNGMTNFGVIARIPVDDVSGVHWSVLSKFMNSGAVLRGTRWDGKSTITSPVTEIPLHVLESMYDAVVPRLTINIADFIGRMTRMFGIGNNWSFYVPEIKLSAGIMDLDKEFCLADGRYPEVSWVGDACTGSVGIVVSAMTGIRAVEKFLK